ncbi:Hypothetical protein AKI40_0865 [Enterobacter sp. FY-07]|nr:Hypothetical protein AKI40_0865 [Enterobacter sp. FY-07]
MTAHEALSPLLAFGASSGVMIKKTALSGEDTSHEAAILKNTVIDGPNIQGRLLILVYSICSVSCARLVKGS